MLIWLTATVFVLLYVGYFGLVARAEWSIYAYLLIWVFVPKAFRLFYLTGDDLPEGITVFNFLDLLAVAAIAVALVARRRRIRVLPAALPVRRVALLLVLAGVVSLVLSYRVLASFFDMEIDGLWHFLESAALPQERILPVIAMVNGAIVAYGCTSFLTTQAQLDVVLGIFLLCGIELAVESVLIFYAGLDLWIGQWAVHEAGRFQSLVFTAQDAVGEFAVLGMCAALYFARARRRRGAYLLAALMILPILATYARSALLAAVVAVLLFTWMATRAGLQRTTYVLLGGTVVLIFLGLQLEAPLMDIIARHAGGETRPDYWSSESMDVRLGYWARGLDLAWFIMPFGTGPGISRYAVQYPFPQHIYALSEMRQSAYDAFLLGQRTTVIHNNFLEFIVENGLLGVLALAAFVRVLVRNAGAWRRRMLSSRGGARPPQLAQACLFSMFAGLGVNAFLEPSRVPYSMYLMLMYLIALAMSLESATTRAAGKHAVVFPPRTEVARVPVAAREGLPIPAAADVPASAG